MAALSPGPTQGVVSDVGDALESRSVADRLFGRFSLAQLRRTVTGALFQMVAQLAEFVYRGPLDGRAAIVG